jgi:hypothetical protein
MQVVYIPIRTGQRRNQENDSILNTLKIHKIYLTEEMKELYN